jgi:hypothetical protein
MSSSGDRFRVAFDNSMRRGASMESLKAAAVDGRLSDWTVALTACVEDACRGMEWIACAKGHAGKALPEGRNEYLTLDLTAFDARRNGWRLPEAAFELENSRSQRRIAYCFWKLLAVNVPLRVLFCYRKDFSECAGFLAGLRGELLQSLSHRELASIAGETLLCIGSRGDPEAFPAGFFRWWRMNPNTTTFESL